MKNSKENAKITNRSTMENFKAVGWNSHFEKEFDDYAAKGFEAGRVIVENRNSYMLYTKHGEVSAEVSGRLLFTAESSSELPKVGDWVVITLFDTEEKAIIHNILKRKTKFSRNVAGKKTDEQIIATNIDVIFIVQGLDDNFNLKRLERTLVMVYESGAKPVVILNKADLCENLEDKIREVETANADVAVMAMSAKTSFGIEALNKIIKTDLTFAFVGSSGVGKSTLINQIIGQEIQKTCEVRQNDSRGRHITSKRELFVLPQGGCLIDTPGMRELQLWNADEGLSEAFADIEGMAVKCHFSDCSHTQEIKCAVLEAVDNGTLTDARYQSYIKLQKELGFLEGKQNTNSYLERKKKGKELQRLIKEVKKIKKLKRS